MLFTLTLLCALFSGNLLLPSEILANLSKILNDNTPKAEYPLGVLTTQNRDEWAKQRIHLEEIGNHDVLRKIDTAIFNLVLDDVTIENNKHKILSEFLHSDGTNRSTLYIFIINLLLELIYFNYSTSILIQIHSLNRLPNES